MLQQVLQYISYGLVRLTFKISPNRARGLLGSRQPAVWCVYSAPMCVCGRHPSVCGRLWDWTCRVVAVCAWRVALTNPPCVVWIMPLCVADIPQVCGWPGGSNAVHFMPIRVLYSWFGISCLLLRRLWPQLCGHKQGRATVRVLPLH